MNTKLQCDFCYHMCTLKEGQRGVCGIRSNQGGKLVSHGWAEVVASALEAIEKKPLYHFFPGSKTLSVALFGCNYRCKFCQNYHISQGERPERRSEKILPHKLAQTLKQSNSKILSFTYSEPVVWLDYVEECATEVKKDNNFTCMITNGSFSKTSLNRILPLIDAFNIDLKGDDNFYREYCGGKLEPVLDSIETIAEAEGKVLEVTTLLIEEIHSARDVRQMGRQLKERGVKVWHLSRFYPQYLMEDYHQTSEHYLERMLEEASLAGIPYIYAGNSNLTGWGDTKCPSCGAPLIARKRTAVKFNGNKCHACGYEIYGRF
ncbi:MAG: AmmeMemoRadiSam system radical SAM enzyme [Sphaerochaetaceae bacterium]